MRQRSLDLSKLILPCRQASGSDAPGSFGGQACARPAAGHAGRCSPEAAARQGCALCPGAAGSSLVLCGRRLEHLVACTSRPVGHVAGLAHHHQSPAFCCLSSLSSTLTYCGCAGIGCAVTPGRGLKPAWCTAGSCWSGHAAAAGSAARGQYIRSRRCSSSQSSSAGSASRACAARGPSIPQQVQPIAVNSRSELRLQLDLLWTDLNAPTWQCCP